MRHLTRLYFDNSAASDKYVAFIDQGIDGDGNPRFNHNVSFMRTAGELVLALEYVLRGAVFFKLPVGATATVDVLVPDVFGSSDPKIFDYQVLKSRLVQTTPEVASQELDEFLKLTQETVAERFRPAESETGEPAGPNEQTGFTGPSSATSFSTCSLYSPSGASCGGQTETECEDPLNTVAVCRDGMLECHLPRVFPPKKP